eukprot:TRINITY_DN95057_c0_g1_i1.p1 TRINITY_DN95057_c0_g1~~TRINITY_DN95057_c0_g1_i1.p1  ORF type:complete len:210 (-),score=49.04 TRINITY_DN95057_c0_g1_i1:66-695(-)
MDSNLSRWFIKDKNLDQKIKATEKSLEAAKRKGNSRMVAALESKLAQLLPGGSTPKKEDAGAPPKKLKRKKPLEARTTSETNEVTEGDARKEAEDILLRAAALAKAKAGSDSESADEGAVKNWWENAEFKSFLREEGETILLNWALQATSRHHGKCRPKRKRRRCSVLLLQLRTLCLMICHVSVRHPKALHLRSYHLSMHRPRKRKSGG